MPGGRLPILRGVSPTPELYSRALSAAYNLEWRIIDPAFAEEKEPDVWELIRRDGKIAQTIMQRTSTIASKNWTVEPGGEEEPDKLLAAFVEAVLRRVPRFRESRKQLAQAVFRGRAYAFVEGRRALEKIGNVGAREWWCPTRLKDVDKRRVQIVPKKKDGRIETAQELWNVSRERWEEIGPHARRQLVEVVYSDEEGRLGYGRGLLDSLYFLWWAKHSVLREGLQGAERWAQGMLIAKADHDLAGDDARSSTVIRDALRNELQKHRGKHVAVVGKTDEVSLVSGGGEGHQIVAWFVEYLDQAISAVGSGAVLPFGSGESTGSLARAEVEKDVSDELLEFDRGVVDEVLTDKVVRLVVNANRSQLSSLGLGDARMPRFLTTPAKHEDPEKNVRVIREAVAAGMKIKVAEAFERIGFTVPQDGDEVLEGQQQQGFGFPPGNGFPVPGAAAGQNGGNGFPQGGGRF